jgi:hypothetical protein
MAAPVENRVFLGEERRGINVAVELVLRNLAAAAASMPPVNSASRQIFSYTRRARFRSLASAL